MEIVYVLLYIISVAILLSIIKTFNKNVLRVIKEKDCLIYILSDDEYLIEKIDMDTDIYTQIEKTLLDRKFELANIVDYLDIGFANDSKINHNVLFLLKK